jgi:hypothetical protein
LPKILCLLEYEESYGTTLSFIKYGNSNGHYETHAS